MPLTLRRVVFTFLVVAVAVAAGLWIATPVPTVAVRVRWTPQLADAARADLERQFSLREGRLDEGTTWAYQLADYSRGNIRRLIEHPNVNDTQGLDRERFEPGEALPPRGQPIALLALMAGTAAALLVIAWMVVPWRRMSLRAVAPVAIIVVMVTLTYLPVLRSGNKVMSNNDFFMFASRQEAVAQSVRRYATLPLRSHWLGGGFNTIADPEDPTLNPLVLFSVVLGGANGIKAIGYLAMLVGGLATYAFTRRVLGHTEWGALFSGLVFGTCLFVPSRIAGGNPNEVCGAWLPLGLLLIGLALQGQRWSLVILPIIFYTMVSDGKLSALMAMMYIGVLCLLAIRSSWRIFPVEGSGAPGIAYRPVTFFLVAVAMTVVIGLPRLLPAFEMIQNRGGITPMMAAHPQQYVADRVVAYTFSDLWKGVLGWDRAIDTETLNRDLLTVGIVPAVLCGIAFLVFWRQTLPWGIMLLLCAWVIMAHHAPVDLLAALWRLPVFDTIYRPYKYFSFEIAFTVAIVGGYAFHLLRQLHSRRVEALLATVLIAFSVGFLYPRSATILSGAFTRDAPALEAPDEFFTVVAGKDVSRIRPQHAVAYFNVRRGVGTLNGFTFVPAPTAVAPRYFVSANDQYVANEAYRGEAYALEPETATVVGAPAFAPNTINLSVDVKRPSIVIINQNYDRDWYTNRGTLSDANGLIALHLTDSGSYSVRLSYRPRSFYAGVALTLVALGAVVIVRSRRAGRSRPRLRDLSSSRL